MKNREAGAARGQRRLRIGAMLAIAVAIGAVVPQTAQAGIGMSDAEKLRRLDIMLMVTGLRCRTGADNFQADYGRFTSRHMPELNRATAQLRSELVARGNRNPARALDRLSVVMANEYGTGHPWLSCAQLKQVTQNLVEVRGTATLVEAAGQLLERQPVTVLALAGR